MQNQLEGDLVENRFEEFSQAGLMYFWRATTAHRCAFLVIASRINQVGVPVRVHQLKSPDPKRAL